MEQGTQVALGGLVFTVLISLIGLAWRVGVLTEKLRAAESDISKLQVEHGAHATFIAGATSDMGWIKGQLHELIRLIRREKIQEESTS